jgi:hypothetical protein
MGHPILVLGLDVGHPPTRFGGSVGCGRPPQIHHAVGLDHLPYVYHFGVLTLSSPILKAGLDTLLKHEYSDFFPLPPELCAVIAGWDEFSTYLQTIDLTRHKPYRPLFSYAPKSRVNLRPVTLLHPVDSVLYFSLVRDIRDELEAHRVPEDEDVVFSFRSENAEEDELYSPLPSHKEFQEEQRVRAQMVPNGFIATADIADFYPRLYQHRVRNALSACLSAGTASYPQGFRKNASTRVI